MKTRFSLTHTYPLTHSFTTHTPGEEIYQAPQLVLQGETESTAQTGKHVGLAPAAEALEAEMHTTTASSTGPSPPSSTGTSLRITDKSKSNAVSPRRQTAKVGPGTATSSTPTSASASASASASTPGTTLSGPSKTVPSPGEFGWVVHFASAVSELRFPVVNNPLRNHQLLAILSSWIQKCHFSTPFGTRFHVHAYPTKQTLTPSFIMSEEERCEKCESRYFSLVHLFFFLCVVFNTRRPCHYFTHTIIYPDINSLTHSLTLTHTTARPGTKQAGPSTSSAGTSNARSIS